jgi:molybdate transport system regulatory protein
LKGEISVRSKVWLEVEGEPFLGVGRLEILRAIERRGSIVGAALDTGIPYRRIWGAIQDMEQCINCPLVVRQRGGSMGGGARLTGVASEFLKHFLRLQEGIQEVVDSKFQHLFTNFLNERSAKSADRNKRREARSP